MKYSIIATLAITSCFMLVKPVQGDTNGHKHPANNGQHRREGYLHDNGKPCPCPGKPCAWRGRCVGEWKERPCGMCLAPGHTTVWVNNTVLVVPTGIPTEKCVSTVLTTVMPSVVCTTFIIPGADNKNCRGERNNMVEELVSKYAKSDAIVFLNGQEIEVKGAIVVSGTTVNTIIKTGVVTVTGADANAAAGQEQSLFGTMIAIGMMAMAAVFI